VVLAFVGSQFHNVRSLKFFLSTQHDLVFKAMVSHQWSGVDVLKKSFVKFNTSFNTSFHSVLSTWKTKDNKNSDTDAAVFVSSEERRGTGPVHVFARSKGHSPNRRSRAKRSTLFTLSEKRYVTLYFVGLTLLGEK
jgi:hypothetical protein